MRSKTLIIHMSLLWVFYFIGTIITMILLNSTEITSQVAGYIFISMALVSFLLIFYYSKRIICHDCRTLNTIMIVLLIVMTLLLTTTGLDMMQPMTLNIF